MSRCSVYPTTWARSGVPAPASGPRGIREASTLFSFGHGGAYDFERDTLYLTAEEVRMVDVGDADIVHTDMEKSHANTEAAVRRILASGAMPVVLGGDHSVHAPVMAAFEDRGPLHIVHFDAPSRLRPTSVTACATATAIRCGAPRSRTTSPG